MKFDIFKRDKNRKWKKQNKEPMSKKDCKEILFFGRCDKKQDASQEEAE